MQTNEALANGEVGHETLVFDSFENEILQKVLLPITENCFDLHNVEEEM